MLYRIFGRKKYGKTGYCFEKLKQNVKERKKSYLIVPEQFTFAMEKRVATELEDRANLFVEVLSFTRLCHRVFQTCGGGSQRFLENAGKLLCMAKSLEAVEGELTEYKKAAEDVRFAASALHAVQEFFSYHITPGDVERILPELEGEDTALCGKLRDISLIGAAYRGELKAAYGTDGEMLEMLNQTLTTQNYFAGADVLVDSFYSFMPQELRILRHMLRQADNCFITVAFCPEDTDPMFERPRETEKLLAHMAEENRVPVSDVILEPPTHHNSMHAIERHFRTALCFHDDIREKLPCGEDIHILRCKNPMEEARAAAACIFELVTGGRARFRDIAVCARDIAAYEGILDTAFEKAGIPYAFSVREDLLTRPIISYITTALDFIQSYQKTSFLCLLKTGLFKLSDDDCALLEEYVRTWNISGKKEFTMDWYMNPAGYKESFEEKDAALLEQVTQAKTVAVDALMKFSEDMHAASCCREMAAAVYRFMGDSSYREQLENSDDVRFWNLTVKALDETVRVFGDESLSINRFLELFKTVITEYGIQDIPRHLDCVLVGAADLIRSENIRYMFVIGCHNEAFPRQNEEDEIFSDRDKRLLRQHAFYLSQGAEDSVYDEFFLAYNLFCEPSDGLYLTYPENDMEGSPLRRSILLNAVSNLFDSFQETVFPFSDPVRGVTTPKALAEDMYVSQDADFRQAAKEILAEQDEDFRRLFSKEGLLNSEGKLSADVSDRLFGQVLMASPSRFETYSRCRFSYFNRYLLKIMPEVRAELDSVQTGLVAHKILEQFVKELAKSKSSGKLMTSEQATERITVLLEEHFRTITHAVLSEVGAEDGISKRFVTLYRRLQTVLQCLAQVLTDELAQSDFLPEGFEVNIGDGGEAVVPADIPIPAGSASEQQPGILKIVGQFDRADVFRADGKTYIRVIDYKTGEKRFREQEVDYGFNLQMLLYLYCLVYGKSHPFGEHVEPAGVLYIPVSRPDVTADLWTDTKDPAEKNLRTAFRGNGILIDDRKVLCAMDKDLSGRFIPVSLTKTGGFTSFSQVCSPEKMNSLLHKAAEVAGELASLMRQGNIQPNPYKTEATNSCRYCDYLPICRLDNRDDRIRYDYEEVLKS